MEHLLDQFIIFEDTDFWTKSKGVINIPLSLPTQKEKDIWINNMINDLNISDLKFIELLTKFKPHTLLISLHINNVKNQNLITTNDDDINNLIRQFTYYMYNNMNKLKEIIQKSNLIPSKLKINHSCNICYSEITIKFKI
jgi:hypothetical protein